MTAPSWSWRPCSACVLFEEALRRRGLPGARIEQGLGPRVSWCKSRDREAIGLGEGLRGLAQALDRVVGPIN